MSSELVSKVTEMIGGDAVAALTSKLGLDGATAGRAVPAAVEVIASRLGNGGEGGGLSLEKGLAALGRLAGGGAPSLPDHAGAVKDLAGKLGLDEGRASGILDTLLPMVLEAVKGGSGLLGSLGKLF